MSWGGLSYDIWTKLINFDLALRSGAFINDINARDFREDVLF